MKISKFNGSINMRRRTFIKHTSILSAGMHPYFYKGTAAEGIGVPHVGQDMIWPMSITMRALTAIDRNEIKNCIRLLQNTHAGKGFMHESFHKDDPAKFTRAWFAWSNTLFGELLWKTYQKMPELLSL